jgi:hypothetical protein
MPRVTGTLTQVATGLPIVNVADVAGAAATGDVSRAISTAASDATEKANAAQSAAEGYADQAVGAIPTATASVAGLATATQISKLDGIAAGAQVNLAVGTTTGTVAAGNDSRFGTISTILPNGTSVAASSYGAVEGPSASPGEYVFLPSGTSDDAARYNALQVAGWRKFRFVAGIYYATTPFISYPHTTLEGHPDAEIRFSLPTASVYDAYFGAPVPTSVNTTLHAAAVVGRKYVIVNLPTDPTLLVKGAFVKINNTAHPACPSLYKIISVTGVGSYRTVELDHSVKRARPANESCQVYPWVNERIIVRGNGMRVSGAANRGQSIHVPWMCETTDLIITDAYGTTTQILGSFDIPGYRNAFRRIKAEMVTLVTSQFGLCLESNEDSIIEDCDFKDSYCAFNLFDCTGCKVLRSRSAGGHTGVFIGTGVSDTVESCVNCVVEDCDLDDQTTVAQASTDAYAAVVWNGSKGTRLNRVKTAGCLWGVDTDPTTSGTVITQLVSENTANAAVRSRSPSLISQNHTSRNDTMAVLVGDDPGGSGAGCQAIVSGLDAISNVVTNGTFAGYQVVVAVGGTVYLSNSDIQHAAGCAVYGSASGGGIKMYLDKVRLSGPANANAILTGGALSVLSVSGVKTTGYGTGGYYAISRTVAGGSIYLGNGNNFASAGAAYHTACDVSVREVALTGTTPVTYPFADLKATSSIQITRKTIVGTKGDVTYTATPSTGISFVSSQASDTGVVSVQIQ